ncbi:MAG: FtsX-like permease family protein [Treponema sp.]|nr:FtsX-like permease family protein [Treponema sp.]
MTKQKFYLKMITSSIMRRKSRMMIALFAVAIGATILSGLITIYYDVPRQMGQEFRSYGANLMLSSSCSEDISEESLLKALRVIPKEKLVGFTAYRYETTRLNKLPFMTGGIDFDSVQKTRPYWGISGNYPLSDDEVILGQTVSQTIAIKEGSFIELAGMDSFGNEFIKKFKVSGILQTGGSEEECIFMKITSMEALMKNKGSFDVAECSISTSVNELETISEIISSSVPELTPRLVKRVTKSEGAVLKKLQSLVWIVTLVVLVLTMVCVATTMMAVVAERRKEIGLKKSLGAQNRSIIKDFMGEGIFIGGLGGMLGVILGFIFAQEVSLNVFKRSISFQPVLIPMTIVISVAITALACLLPIKSATDVDPALVLKGE